MRLLVSATRKDMPLAVVQESLAFIPVQDPIEKEINVVVHGGRGGAERQIVNSLKEKGWRSEAYPILSSEVIKYGASAGPLRNRKMVAKPIDFAIFLPDEESKGVWDCYHQYLNKKENKVAGVLYNYERKNFKIL